MLVGGPKLPENHQNQVERPKLNGLRIEMTNLQGFIVWGLKLEKHKSWENKRAQSK
jgi:hypothetical protein